MVAADQIRAMALALPEAEDRSTAERLAFEVRGRGFAWTWLERAAPKSPRKPRLDVLAVRCRPEEKDLILESDPAVYFTEPHYNGFPAVLVRLEAIAEADLAALLAVAWRCQAPKALLKTIDASR
jgi:hypothetical protein